MAEQVNHPDHYGGKDDPYEAIKVIEAWNLGFHLGNTVKYIARNKRKGSEFIDLKKARWYLDRKLKKFANEVPSNLYIRNTLQQAKRSLEILGLSEKEWMPIGIGCSLVGQGFDKIVFDINEEILSERQLENYLEWRQNSVHCRLNNPNEGEIIDI